MCSCIPIPFGSKTKKIKEKRFEGHEVVGFKWERDVCIGFKTKYNSKRYIIQPKQYFITDPTDDATKRVIYISNIFLFFFLFFFKFADDSIVRAGNFWIKNGYTGVLDP